MPANDVADRLLDARSRLDDLRGAVEARAPWPASENFGADPESSWYPPELLAHVAEMVPYWMAQIERRGTHPTRGEMTVGAIIERMLIDHIGEHVEQLGSILGSPPERG